jgi:RRXRR protein
MPSTREGWVRRALKSGKAKCVSRLPFTIQLTYVTETHVLQPLVLGIDPGSKEAGFAVRRVGTEEVVYASVVKMRTGIVSKMKRRASYRRNRRARKTRYRACRFNNRTRADGWLPPSVQSKVNSTNKEIKFIFKLLPITCVRVEKCAFDTHKLSDPTVFGVNYHRCTG